MDSLEEFEKQLAQEKINEQNILESKVRSHREKPSDRQRHEEDRHHHHHRHHHHRKPSDKHRKKRSKLSHEEEDHVKKKTSNSEENHDEEKKKAIIQDKPRIKRDDWMEAPPTIDSGYAFKRTDDRKSGTDSSTSKLDYKLNISKNELNLSLLDNTNTYDATEKVNIDDSENPQCVSYKMGDAGSQWRMTKLRAVYTQAKQSGKTVDEIAIERYDNLQEFDHAREEQLEVERRKIFGEGYIWKEKPTGEIFRQRGVDQNSEITARKESIDSKNKEESLSQTTVNKLNTNNHVEITLDLTELNRMKAQLIKARLKKSDKVAKLEEDYNKAMKEYTENSSKPTIITLGHMENRMLAGTRGEVIPINNKKGRERGLVKDNEDMSIEDMVREERRTKGQHGGDSLRAAESIAKDSKFETDLDYMDDNACRLAKRVQKSNISLKNIAINDWQKWNHALEHCQLCHHEEKNIPCVAPVISLATRVFLTLPTEPELSEGGAVIVPLQHRTNLLECDDDEWEEIRNFMKCLTRMYHEQGRDIIFYENAAVPHKKRHAAMQAIPIPYSLGEIAPAFFKEAICSSDEEWTQHRKIIDTAARSRQGLGKNAFRQMIAKEMPYFHVWFDLNGGLGHIVEDSHRWPKGDLFSRQIIGGMLDIEPGLIRKQGRWITNDKRISSFKARWRKFDWTNVLLDE
ncbi:Pre-mRNA-splicing factor cwf19 [Golovinomyces cichoracearum]|uniref:Pre-mRNA-splicing factor cwf19 n=1 Tax=Golovinomyces cichoracearum TaxID=62708 RepID=A0A420HC31_9PEZI|nr:Pre-mRNA-splicing factor cwf19 [Golovinomyces cichoracearum]